MTLADIRVGLVSYLYGDVSIYDRVGGGLTKAQGGRRIYPVVLPQGQTLDSIVYSRISGLGDHHTQGPSGLSRPRMQIDCWSKTADGADSLARLVKERVDGFSGTIEWDENSPANAVTVQGIFFTGTEFEDFDSAAALYRSSKDYYIWFEER